MDGASIPTIEMAQNKAYTALFGVSTEDFQLHQGDPSLLAGIPTLTRVAAWGAGFPIKVNGRSCRANTLRTLLRLRKSYRSSSNKKRDKFSWAK
jgi:hypothetical protein